MMEQLFSDMATVTTIISIASTHKKLKKKRAIVMMNSVLSEGHIEKIQVNNIGVTYNRK